MPDKFDVFCGFCNTTTEFKAELLTDTLPQILREWAILALKPRSVIEALVKTEGEARLERCSVCDSVLFVCKM